STCCSVVWQHLQRALPSVPTRRSSDLYTFSKPFYYGRFHNMVMAYFFTEPEEGYFRFSQSPNGAGEGNPAWDFYYILPHFKTGQDRKSTRLNSSHVKISYAVFCLKKIK